MAKKIKNKYHKILNLDPEDMFNSKEVERISLGRLYYEEQLQDLKLVQNNFEMSEAMYNGARDSDGKY